MFKQEWAKIKSCYTLLLEVDDHKLYYLQDKSDPGTIGFYFYLIESSRDGLHTPLEISWRRLPDEIKTVLYLLGHREPGAKHVCS